VGAEEGSHPSPDLPIHSSGGPVKHSNRYATRHAARTKKLIAELRRERDVLAGDLRAERLRAETLKAALAATKRLDLSDPNMAGYAVIRLGREDRFPGRPLGISLMIDLERLRLRLFR